MKLSLLLLSLLFFFYFTLFYFIFFNFSNLYLGLYYTIHTLPGFFCRVLVLVLVLLPDLDL